MSSLDQTGGHEAPDTVENYGEEAGSSSQETQQGGNEETLSSPPKKKMNSFLKVILIVGVVFILAISAFAGYIMYLQNSGPSRNSWEPVEPKSTANELVPATQQAQPERAEPSVKVETAQSVFKPTGAVDRPKLEMPKLSAPQSMEPAQPIKTAKVFDQSSDFVKADPEPVTEMERYAAASQSGSLDNSEEHGHLSLGHDAEDDLHNSVLAEVRVMLARQEEHEQRFKSFDLAATALHRAHNDQLNVLSVDQKRTNAAVLGIKKDILQLKSQIERLDSKDLEKTLEKVESSAKAVDKLVAQSQQNDRNIKWLSRERLCLLEAQLGVTKYSKQCSEFNKEHKAKAQPLAIQSIPQQAASPQGAAVFSGNPDVPATVGVVANPAPVANTAIVASNRPANPCTYADRTWKLQLISGTNALLVRGTDGFETVVEPHTSIPGLGRAQLFNAQGYPQYVQFTNGIVCGG
ncbi:hypothetical protein [Neptuniibacter halophilus]|uniref:hypothetical protein n=1 Tax=Neptuniibacter halophilus TaxID=651666 RepID=UPI002573784D|nr:hypothetical protein [Neptuniibacter halophilus]